MANGADYVFRMVFGTEREAKLAEKAVALAVDHVARPLAESNPSDDHVPSDDPSGEDAFDRIFPGVGASAGNPLVREAMLEILIQTADALWGEPRPLRGIRPLATGTTLRIRAEGSLPRAGVAVGRAMMAVFDMPGYEYWVGPFRHMARRAEIRKGDDPERGGKGEPAAPEVPF